MTQGRAALGSHRFERKGLVAVRPLVACRICSSRCVCRVELEGGPCEASAVCARSTRMHAGAALTSTLTCELRTRPRAAALPRAVGPLSYCSVVHNNQYTVRYYMILYTLRVTSSLHLPFCAHRFHHAGAFAGMQTRHRIATEYPWRQRLVMRHMLQTRTSSAYGLEARRRTSHCSHSHPRVVPALSAASAVSLPRPRDVSISSSSSLRSHSGPLRSHSGPLRSHLILSDLLSSSQKSFASALSCSLMRSRSAFRW